MQKINIEDCNAYDDIKKIIYNQEKQLKMEQELYKKRRQMKLLAETEDIENDCAEEYEVFNRKVDADTHDEILKKMNKEQQKIFNYVINTIENKVYKKIKSKNKSYIFKIFKENNNGPQMLLYICGTAGTGKSFLINTLADHLTLKYTIETNRATKPAVILAAPTGIAAIQIKGATIHSVFSLEVQHGRDVAMKPMKGIILNTKRNLFENVKLVIIDEISMCSNIMLTKIHKRLTEIYSNQSLFGNLNILVLGDLLQLSSVRAPPVFQVFLQLHKFK